MKKIYLAFALLFSAILVQAAYSDTVKLYHPEANASKDISEAIKQAKKDKKHVLIQAGGNWCSWCIRFNAFTTGDQKMDSAIKADYIVYHLNYSSENKKYEVFKKYGFPQRFGFPVFLILDGNGTLIHTENSSYLEEGKGYNKGKILEFLHNWSAGALDEEKYKSDKK